MPPPDRDDSSRIDELLEQGLKLFAANRVEQAVARWRQVLDMVPGEPRALDYLASAGHPFAEGTGQNTTPISPESPALGGEDMQVFEVAPISHRSAWPRASATGPLVPRPAPRRRLAMLAPWVVIATLVPVVGYLVFAQVTGRSERDAPAAAAARPIEGSARPPAASREAPPAAATARAEMPRAEPAAGSGAADPPAAATPARAARAAADGDTYVVSLAVVPAGAVIRMDGHEVARGNYIARLKRDGASHALEISAPKYQPRIFTFVDEPPPERVRLAPIDRDRLARRTRKGQREAERVKPHTDEAAPPRETPPASAPASAPAPAPAPAPPPAERKSDNIDPWATSR